MRRNVLVCVFPLLITAVAVVPADEAKPSEDGLLEVENLRTIAKEYRDNPIAASKKYDGKRVRIRGHAGPAEKVEKRANEFWLMEDIGQSQVGNTLISVYGVEYRLSKDGEDQFAKLKANDRYDMDLIGTVKGTRPYALNEFGGTMLQIVDCSYATSTKPKKEKEKKKKLTAPSAKDRKTKQGAEEALRQKKEYQAAVEDAKARREMRGAISLLDRGFKDEARKRLQAIVEKYPETPTAEQAKRQLDKLDKK